MISFNKNTNIFHLTNGTFSYYIQINKLGYLINLHCGKFVQDIYPERVNERYIERYAYLDGDKEVCDESYYFSFLSSSFECSSNLKGDTRGSHTIYTHSDGSRLTNFKYFSYKILKGKYNSETLPHVRLNNSSEAETLVITLKDSTENVYLELYYTVFKDKNVIVRSSKIINKENFKIKLNRISSIQLDCLNQNFQLLSMHGSWSDDRELELQDIKHAKLTIDDNRGARGFKNNPAAIIKTKDTTFNEGYCFGIYLVYSGNFKIETRLDETDLVRTFALINDENFEYTLNPDDSFETPEAILSFGFNGINSLTHTMHDLIRDNLIPKKFVYKERPILINSWEAYYFDFDTTKIKSLIKEAHELGIEMLVLDDGWFGKRNSDNSSLGDWNINENKINLKEVIDYAHSLKMKFGLWIEPEMISPDSNLYRNHPEFALYNRKEKPTLLRHQLCLDLTNDDAINAVFNQIKLIFDNYDIDYCKWDFNRFLTEIGTAESKYSEGELYHRFTLGTYKLFDMFTKRYPNILLESCASGGGRFDLGMLYYSPQIWASDETDPYARVMLQFTTNIFYPLSTIGAHVSASNALSMQDKAIIAAFGTFGYELDLLKLGDQDKKTIQEINKLIKARHHVVTEGDYYSLSNPYESNFAAWNIVTKNKKECLVFNFNFKREPTKARFIRLQGLKPDAFYFNSLTNDVYKGDFYMNIGLNISAPLKEGMTMLFVLKEVGPLVESIVNKKARKVKREKLL